MTEYKLQWKSKVDKKPVEVFFLCEKEAKENQAKLSRQGLVVTLTKV